MFNSGEAAYYLWKHSPTWKWNLLLVQWLMFSHSGIIGETLRWRVKLRESSVEYANEGTWNASPPASSSPSYLTCHSLPLSSPPILVSADAFSLPHVSPFVFVFVCRYVPAFVFVSALTLSPDRPVTLNTHLVADWQMREGQVRRSQPHRWHSFIIIWQIRCIALFVKYHLVLFIYIRS